LRETIERDAERFGDSHRDEQRRAELATLEARDVIARQAARVCQLDLRPTLVLTGYTDALADARREVTRVFRSPPRVCFQPSSRL